MRKSAAILGSVVFFVAVPFLLAGLVPWWITRWQLQQAFWDLQPTRAVGFVLILAGISGLVDSFRRFATEGLGTPAPVAPPKKLVVTGLYGHVRNPMYLAVVALILGQALLLGDWRLLAYVAVFWLACHMFVLVYEEPTLEQTFGAEYVTYRAGVPRWIPRVWPWRPQ